MLDEGLARLGIEASSRQREMIDAYIDELLIWNSKLNLVSVRSREELVVRHILDCLAGLEIVRDLGGRSIADIGSGAGLPGMLLAIFLEDRMVTLVERSGKKAGFLRSTSALLGLVDRVSVIDRDLKAVDAVFDVVTLRAFREFGDFIGQIRRITSPGGSIAAFKGRHSSVTSDLAAAGLKDADAGIIPISVPFLDEERNMMVLKN